MTKNGPYEIASFGEWVKHQRNMLNITQAALANIVGCAVVTIKKIERDERRPSLQIAQLLAAQLAIPDLYRQDFLNMARGKFVAWERRQQQNIHPPEFLRSFSPLETTKALFVARRHELSWLKDQFSRSLSGNGRVNFVLGEAGSGKTALLVEFARLSQKTHANLIIAQGNCNARSGIGDPYLPFRDILNMLCGDLELEWAMGQLSQEQVICQWNFMPVCVRTILEFGPNLINKLVPGKAVIQRLISASPEDPRLANAVADRLENPVKFSSSNEQGEILAQISTVLLKLATQCPLLILLDDLQWIDDASKNLLFQLGRRLSGSRILILGAYRPSEVALGMTGETGEAEPHPLTAVINELKRTYGDIQIDLDQTEPSEAQEFVNAYLDSEPNDLRSNFRNRLFQHTAGHPLFTIETLRYMQENGQLVRNKAGEWVEGTARPSDSRLPARVEAVIEQRIDRLDRTQRELLNLASVEGEYFTLQFISKILGIEEIKVSRLLSRDLYRRHKLIGEMGEITIGNQRLTRYRFGHLLIQEFLYNQLSRAEQRIYHRAIGAALEEVIFQSNAQTITLFPDQAYLDNRHRLQDLYSGDLEEFGPALVHQYSRAEEWAKVALFAMVLADRAMAVYAMREAILYYEQALSALNLAETVPEIALFDVIIGWENAAFNFRPYSKQFSRLERAEKIARDHQDSQRLIQALHWKAEVYLAEGLWTRAGPILMEALALADTTGNERLAIRPTFFKGLMTLYASPKDALTLMDQALELAQRYDDLRILASAYGTKAQILAQLGNFQGALEALEAARVTANQFDSPLTEADVELLAGWTYLTMGDTQRSLEYSRRSVEKAIATDNMDCICSGYACLGFGNLEEQNVPGAETAFKEAISRSEQVGAIIPKLMGESGLAMTHFFQGDTDAILDLEQNLKEMRTYQNMSGEANTAQMLATCLIEYNEIDQADRYLKLALDYYRQAQMIPYLLRALQTKIQLSQKMGRQDILQATQAEIDGLMQSLGQ